MMIPISFIQKTPGEWSLVVKPMGLRPDLHDVLTGMSEHLGELFGAAIAHFGGDPQSPLWIDLRAMAAEERINAGENTIRPMPESGCVSDALRTLGDFIDCAVWFSLAAMAALKDDRLVDSIALHTLAVKLLAQYQTSLDWLEASIEDDGGAGLSPAERGKMGGDKKNEPFRDLQEYATKKYRNGAWKSARQARDKLLKDVIEHGKTIGAHLTETNAENTLYRWLLEAGKNVTAG